MLNRDKETDQNTDGDKSELEKLTDRLITEEEELLKIRFRKLVNERVKLKKKTNKEEQVVLGVDDAHRILKTLLAEAVLGHAKLGSRLGRSVEDGNLYKQYFGRMRVLNNLTNIAYQKMKIMQRAREKYELEYNDYITIRQKMYLSEMTPTEPKEKKSEKAVWELMDEMKQDIP